MPQERTLDHVPTLAFGRGKDCTFAGAIEAAMAVTDHPCAYTDLMGWSGLAFRTRWWRWKDKPNWCPSAAVGEFPPESQRIADSSGWRFRHVVHFGQPLSEQGAADILASIDAGKPVVGYDDCWDVSLAYGYQQGGRLFLWRNYMKGDKLHEVPAEKLVGWWMILDLWEQPPSRLESFKAALRTAVDQWKLEHGDGGIGGRDYWYGKAALQAWSRDLVMAEGLDESVRKGIYHPSRFSFFTMRDARAAGIAFLRQHLDLLGDSAKALIEQAARLYEDECALLRSASDDWVYKPEPGHYASVRPRQQEMLARVGKLEQQAIAAMEQALVTL